MNIEFASALPPDVPAPPAARGGGVRWPDGVVRAPGELPDGGVQHETFPYRARLKTLALAAGLALSAVALALVRRRRRR
ncbi:MAG TPA: hypothetical protein VI122_15320 [Thermoleophilaceae bacterium]